MGILWRKPKIDTHYLEALDTMDALRSKPAIEDTSLAPLTETPWVPTSKKDWEDFKMNLGIATGNVVIGRTAELPEPTSARIPKQALPTLIEAGLAQEAS